MKIRNTLVSRLLEAAYGFDLTDISGSRWQEVLQAVGASSSPNLVMTTTTRGASYGAWYWQGSGILLVTKNNPITGEYAPDDFGDGKGKRVACKLETGYASYIGIEGDAEKVALAAKLIRKFAGYVKGVSKGSRDYI